MFVNVCDVLFILFIFLICCILKKYGGISDFNRLIRLCIQIDYRLLDLVQLCPDNLFRVLDYFNQTIELEQSKQTIRAKLHRIQQSFRIVKLLSCLKIRNAHYDENCFRISIDHQQLLFSNYEYFSNQHFLEKFYVRFHPPIPYNI